MIVDCMTCSVRGLRCDDCAISVLRTPGLAEPLSPAEPQLATELQLDAAENEVVTMFVGVGLVSAGAVARLRARRESMQHWEAVRHVC